MRSPFPPGFDGPRPLRPGFADRLLAEMESADVFSALSDLDAPRPLPADLDARLEASLAGAVPVPPRVRRRLVRSMAPRPAGTGSRWAVAAILAVLLGMSSVAYVTADRTVRDEMAESAGSSGAGGSSQRSAAPGGRDGDDPADPRPVRERGEGQAGEPSGAGGVVVRGPDGSVASVNPIALGGGSASGVRVERRGPQPPFAFGPEDDAPPSFGSAQPFGPVAARPPAPALPALRVGVTDDASPFARGFAAYVRLLNEEGGVRGRHLRLVPASARAAARGLLAVVNGSPSPMATADGPPPWVDGPLVEHPRAPEEVLAGPVVSMASVVERQAHLAVLGAFPKAPQPGDQAVVYEQEGPYGRRVGDAYRTALGRLGTASVLTVSFDPGKPLLVPGSTAAFLALDGDAARAWLAEAQRQGHAPPGGVWGVESLFDASLVHLMGGAVRVASPFAPASTAEAAAVEAGAGRFDAEALAGWVAAKALAVAVWRTGADTGPELVAALRELRGWRTSFLPRYEVRDGTTSRTPEAVTLRVADGVFVPVGDFRRDPL